MKNKVYSTELLPYAIFDQVKTDTTFFVHCPIATSNFSPPGPPYMKKSPGKAACGHHLGCEGDCPSTRNDRKQLGGRSTPSSKAHRFTYFHPLSRGSQIRNNQNPAGNNIRHLNWVGGATDVSSVSLGGSFFGVLKKY